MSKPSVIIPNVRNPGSNTGLLLREGIWQVRFLENGKKKSVSTGMTSEQAARTFRDTLFAKLLKAGAKVATRKKFTTERRAEKAKGDPDAYIRKREPYVVVIDGATVAECGSRKAAREARDKYLGVA